MNNNLIFDIGFHKGEDTRFYLSWDYNVLAVDAVESLVEAGNILFSKEVESGQLVIKRSVVSSKDDGESTFYISPNSLWNSAHKEIAERKGMTATKILAPSCTLRSLMQQYDVPYYCKIDIEGNDILALESLRGSTDLPQYISVETECISDDSRPEDVTFR